MAQKLAKPTIYYVDGLQFYVFTHKKPVLCDKCDLTRRQCNELLMPCRYHDVNRSVLKQKK